MHYVYYNIELSKIKKMLHKQFLKFSTPMVHFVYEIVIDANMELWWHHRLSLMPPSPTCNALDPL